MKLCECGCGEPAPIAKQNHTKYGWIKGQPMRFVLGHTQRGRRRSVRDIFEEHVVRNESSCWGWNGALANGGYGILRTATEAIRAHRASWEIYHGPIPEGMQVLHSCDNPPCTRPDHLFLGTPKSNSDDKVSKKRQAKGYALPHTKLTHSTAQAIRDEYAASEISQEALASKYGVARQTVGKVVRGERWLNG